MTTTEAAPEVDDDNRELVEQVTEWLDANWDPDLTVREWWSRVGAAGWSAPHFPVEWGGRGHHRRAVVRVRQAFHDAGAVLPPSGLGLLMAAPTILTHGTPEQIDRLVPSVYDGSVAWCQLFSEPGAGSDLAGLTTRAERDGDHWVISGQKVWSSMAMEADYGMLLARTNFDVAKHAGISWFAFRLDQPGVTIRPLREITGHAMFNEVFFDGAIADDADLIGGENNGWAVTQTTLMFERSGIGAGGTMANFPPAGPKGGFLDLRAGDAARRRPPAATSKVLTADGAVRAGAPPRSRRRSARPSEAGPTGRVHEDGRVDGEALGGGAGARARARPPQPGQDRQDAREPARGRDRARSPRPRRSAVGPGWSRAGRYSEALVFSVAASIYGGTDQIQRNVIGERALGLPREPDPNKGLPFRDVLDRTSREQPR